MPLGCDWNLGPTVNPLVCAFATLQAGFCLATLFQGFLGDPFQCFIVAFLTLRALLALLGFLLCIGFSRGPFRVASRLPSSSILLATSVSRVGARGLSLSPIAI